MNRRQKRYKARRKSTAGQLHRQSNAPGEIRKSANAHWEAKLFDEICRPFRAGARTGGKYWAKCIEEWEKEKKSAAADKRKYRGSVSGDIFRAKVLKISRERMT